MESYYPVVWRMFGNHWQPALPMVKSLRNHFDTYQYLSTGAANIFSMAIVVLKLSTFGIGSNFPAPVSAHSGLELVVELSGRIIAN